MFCNQCGGRIADGSVFCNLCGARQGVVAPAGAPQGGPAPGVPGYAAVAPGVPPQPGPAAPYNPNAPPPMAAPPPMPQNLKCNSCGASLKPTAGVAVLVCEYCGAVTTMGTSGAAEVMQNHYMLDNKLNNETAMNAGGQWLNKGLFRRKVAERSELGQVTLKYVPYWIVPTSVVADFSGQKNVSKSVNQNGQWTTVTEHVPVHDRIQFQQNFPVVAVRGYNQYQPKEGFQFQLGGKVNFDKRATGGVEVQSGDVAEAEAKGQASASAHAMAEKQAHARVDVLQSIDVYPTTYSGELVHVPVWFMEYTHKGKQMHILIDGNSGQVMNGERPAFSLW